MEKPCAAKVDIELGGVEKVINRNKSNQCMLLCFCATKNHHLNLQSVCLCLKSSCESSAVQPEIKGWINMGWCLGETHPTHPLHVAGKECQSSAQVFTSSGFADIFNLDFSFDYQLVLFNSFDSLLFSELYFVYCSSLR